MAKLLKLRRGTNTQHTTFTGAEGEVTVNTTNDSLHVHDGTTAGGREVARADLSNVSGATTGGNITIGGNLSLQDNNKALFGTGDDLQIYHDGSNSYIEDAGTGSLRIVSNGTAISLQSSTENYLQAVKDGAVTVYHDNAAKLATTSTGINVTGTVTCDGLTSDGDTTISNGGGRLVLRDNADSGSASQQYISGLGADNGEDWYLGQTSSGNPHVHIVNRQGGEIQFGTNDTFRHAISGAGHWIPQTTNAYDLGSSSNQFRDGYFDGTVNCDGLTCEGTATITSGNGVFFLKDSNSTGTGTQCYVSGRDSANSEVWYVGQTSTGSSAVDIVNTQNSDILFGTNNSYRSYISSNGHYVPYANNTYDLGTSSNRWRNVYTNDLNLSNEGGTNDVDGTWGSWTIQEGEDDLFLLNRRNGKKYKFNLSEVN